MGKGVSLASTSESTHPSEVLQTWSNACGTSPLEPDIPHSDRIPSRSPSLPLFIAGIYRFHERHCNFPALGIFVLLYFYAHGHFVEYSDLDVFSP